MILDTINSVPTGTGRCQTRRRFPPSQGVTLLAPCPLWRGVVDVSVVTYDDLFQLIIIFISFAGLIYQITKKK